NIIQDTGGVFPELDGKPVETPFRDDLLAAKVTADMSASQFLQVRYGYQKNSQLYGVYANHTPDSFGTISNKYESILAGLQSQFGQNALNELVFQYTKFDNAITPNSDNPTIYFASGVLSGQNPNTPQTTRQTKYQYKDDFSFFADWHGSHDLKFGVNFVHEPTLAGDFSVGTAAPTYTLNGDSLDSSVASISQNGGFSGYNSPKNIYDAYIQDDWRPSPRLTVNVGLRYDLNLGYDLNQSSNQICQELSTQTQFNDASYYQDFRGWDCKLTNDHKNWAPRLGFTYDLTGQGKTLVHGGWGVYYDFPYLNATLLFPAIALTDYGQIYSSTPPPSFRIGDPLPPNDLPGTVGPAPTEVADPTVTKTPFSRQLSVGISHQVSDWLGLSLEYSHINYRDLPYRFKFNILQADGTPRFPDFGGTVRMWNGGGYADYDGMNLGFNARVSNKLRFQGFYTLSHATGNVLLGADEFRLTHSDAQPDLGGSSYGGRKDVSVNPLDPNCHDICKGDLFTDARHKVTLGGTYSAPWGINVSGVIRYRSATPYLAYDGRDLNGDGYNIDLQPGHHLMEARGHSFEQTDIAISKDFTFTGSLGVEIIAQVFNIFNATNPAYYNGRQFLADGTPNPDFGKPQAFAGDTHQGEQRLLQLAARVHF
ncbi:MAG TPA: TonB-dependent receptor, partial [Thermoanaerobaculia bacterium]|nr:TonB-dependent receptor [Thermoanaerobaculia bacterium]